MVTLRCINGEWHTHGYAVQIRHHIHVCSEELVTWIYMNTGSTVVNITVGKYIIKYKGWTIIYSVRKYKMHAFSVVSLYTL